MPIDLNEHLRKKNQTPPKNSDNEGGDNRKQDNGRRDENRR